MTDDRRLTSPRFWAFALSGVLVAALVIVAVAVVRQNSAEQATSVRADTFVELVNLQRQGCLRGTLDRISSARKNAADAKREELLSHIPGYNDAEQEAHAFSADEARRAAQDELSRTGLAGTFTTDEILRIDATSAPILKQRRAYCNAQYPYPQSSVQGPG